MLSRRIPLYLVLFIVFSGITCSLYPLKTGLLIHPEWSYNKVIYEVNIRQFSEEGTFRAFQDYLPELKKMGVGIIWLMPIHPIGEKNRKGSLGSYYSVQDYYGINPDFGNEEDFQSLVDEIHRQEMYVIIDWVANHSAWDNVWVRDHPDFYTTDSAGNFIPPVADWSDVIDLNYENKQLRSRMLDAMKFWVEKFNIDGYRCDVAGMVPLDFWKDVRTELDKIKPVFMLAEAWEPELHEAFDMTYSWDIYHLINDVAKGEKTAVNLKTRLLEEQEMYPRTAFRMQFTSNHDENSWNGTVFERLGDAAETFGVFISLIPGMALIYNGQEAGLDKRLEFFEKDTIYWKEHELRRIYTLLFNLKKSSSALWNGEKGGEMKIIPSENKNIFAFVRINGNDRVFAVFNMSDQSADVELKSSDLVGNYTELFENKKESFSSGYKKNMGPWEYKVYIN